MNGATFWNRGVGVGLLAWWTWLLRAHPASVQLVNAAISNSAVIWALLVAGFLALLLSTLVISTVGGVTVPLKVYTLVFFRSIITRPLWGILLLLAPVATLMLLSVAH